jgi:hypothetical protein
MQADPKSADSGWFVVSATSKSSRESVPMTLGDRIMKLLRISKWSDLLAEGDEAYFRF